MHGDAPRHRATLVAGLIISGLISDKGPVAALTVDVVSSMGVEVGGDAMYEPMHSYIG